MNTVAVGVAIATVAWVAATAARTVAPLVAPELGEQTEMLGGRTRAALEREKLLVLRSIKEVEFDRAMGKISDADFHEVAARLRARAAGLLRQLDADSSGYRVLIERELGDESRARPGASQPPAASARGRRRPMPASARGHVRVVRDGQRPGREVLQGVRRENRGGPMKITQTMRPGRGRAPGHRGRARRWRRPRCPTPARCPASRCLVRTCRPAACRCASSAAN